jgi:outer membrane receptor protein involved in Fe transport
MPNDDSMYYLSYAEGFKSGGFNSVDDQNPVFLADGTILRNTPGTGFEYGDETAWSLELGGKHTLLDGAMNFNWNVFSSVYQDLQVSTFVGLGFVVANAAEAKINGLEIDATWQVTEKLRANLSLGLLDGEYDSFPGAGCTAEQQNALLGLGTLTPSSPQTSALGCQQKFLGDGTPSGQSQDLAGGPLGSDYSGSLGLEYVQPLSGGMAWFTQMDVNFTDSYYMTGDLDPVDVQSGFEKINLRSGVRGDNWMVMLYGRNVTDELTAAGAADVPLALGSHFQYRSIGAVWGVQGVWEF